MQQVTGVVQPGYRVATGLTVDNYLIVRLCAITGNQCLLSEHCTWQIHGT